MVESSMEPLYMRVNSHGNSKVATSLSLPSALDYCDLFAMSERSASEIFREYLEAYLQNEGTSANALAAKAGIHRKSIADVLNMPERSMRISNAESLAEAMGTTLSDILTAGQDQVDWPLLRMLISGLLEPLVESETVANGIAQAVQRTYETALSLGISAEDQKEIRAMTHLMQKRQSGE